MQKEKEPSLDEENVKVISPLLPYKTEKLTKEESWNHVFSYIRLRKYDYRLVIANGIDERQNLIHVPYHIYLSNLINECITELLCNVDVLYNDHPLSQEYLEMTIEELYKTKFKDEEFPVVIILLKVHIVFYNTFSDIFKPISNFITSACKRSKKPPLGYQKLEFDSEKDYFPF